jgi:hypothetical protein
VNYAIYHDRYQRTSDGWKFTKRVYEIRYLDTTPLAGSAPHPPEEAGFVRSDRQADERAQPPSIPVAARQHRRPER